MEPDPAPFLFGSWRGAWCAIRAAGVGAARPPRSHGRPFVGHRDAFISNRDQPRGPRGPRGLNGMYIAETALYVWVH
jgi:hypothetical protein